MFIVTFRKPATSVIDLANRLALDSLKRELESQVDGEIEDGIARAFFLGAEEASIRALDLVAEDGFGRVLYEVFACGVEEVRIRRHNAMYVAARDQDERGQYGSNMRHALKSLACQAFAHGVDRERTGHD